MLEIHHEAPILGIDHGVFLAMSKIFDYFIFLFPQTIFCVVYVAIVYYLTSQPPAWDRFSMFLAACLLISFVAQSVGLVVGAAMNVQVCNTGRVACSLYFTREFYFSQYI